MTNTEVDEGREQAWPPERVWLPTGVVQLAAVSPELENVEGAHWIREDVHEAAIAKAKSEGVEDFRSRLVAAIGVKLRDWYAIRHADRVEEFIETFPVE